MRKGSHGSTPPGMAADLAKGSHPVHRKGRTRQHTLCSVSLHGQEGGDGETPANLGGPRMMDENRFYRNFYRIIRQNLILATARRERCLDEVQVDGAITHAPSSSDMSYVGLITRRSKVQILPPPPRKEQVRALLTGRALLRPENHPYSNPYNWITWCRAGHEAQAPRRGVGASCLRGP